jgi:hypothetical protein
MKKYDLNGVMQRYTDCTNQEPRNTKQSDCSIRTSGNMVVESIFKNLEERVIEKIHCADAVVGCVAWLTNEKILEALSNVKEGVSLIVQKEDFLRPDLAASNNYKSRLQQQYHKLRSMYGPIDGQFEGKSEAIGEMSDEWWIDKSIRCVGFAKQKNEITIPRMHHKFLVFCKYLDNFEKYWPYIPYAVWTGSFNMTFNGTQSIENAIYIENEEISESYFNEWNNMLMISEALDWTSEYAEPDIQFNNLGIIS